MENIVSTWQYHNILRGTSIIRTLIIESLNARNYFKVTISQLPGLLKKIQLVLRYLVNLKFAIPQCLDIFGCHYPDNWGPSVSTFKFKYVWGNVKKDQVVISSWLVMSGMLIMGRNWRAVSQKLSMENTFCWGIFCIS